MKTLINSLLLLLAINLNSQSIESLKTSFETPPRGAKPQVWWHWMSGNVTKYGITKDLEMLNKIGVSGVTQFNNLGKSNARKPAAPIGPVKFMSKNYQKLVQYSIDECDRLGMTLGLQICDGFATAGGPWVTPENAMRTLEYKLHEVNNGKNITFQIPKDLIKILAYPKENEQKINKKNIKQITPVNPYIRKNTSETLSTEIDSSVDLTSFAKNGKFKWKAKKNDYVIIVFYHKLKKEVNHPASPEGLGWESNKFSTEGTDAVFDHVVGPLIDQAGSKVKKTLKHVLIDSWECGYQTWTAKFIEEFKTRRGYDPTPYLPIIKGMLIYNEEFSNRFLVDYRVTLDDLVAENFYGHVRERLHKKGVELHSEVIYGWKRMFGNSIRLYGEIDVPMNEFWFGKVKPNQRVYTGYAPASAHVYGKKVIKDEAFTIGGAKGDFSYAPSQMKSLGDFMFCRGTNKFVLHTSVHQPDDLRPGWTHICNGVNFHRGNTWWPYAKTFIDYLSRCSYMLQEGLFVADVVRYVGEEDTFSDHHGIRANLKLAELPEGYRADHSDNKALLERMKVKNGRIVLPDGMSYKVLLLADKTTMSMSILKKIKSMVEEGAIVVGKKPLTTPGLLNYPECDEELNKLASQLWVGYGKNELKEAKHGKGKIIWGKSLKQVLSDINLQPDFSFKTSIKNRLNFLHRKVDNSDTYFVISSSHKVNHTECSFRINNKQPYLLDPLTGKLSQITVFKQANGVTTIPLTFKDYGSKFIVFKGKTLKHITDIKVDENILFGNTSKINKLPFNIDAEIGTKTVLELKQSVKQIQLKLSNGNTKQISVNRTPIRTKINGAWDVQFEEGRGAPSNAKFEKLISWSDHTEKGIKFFSGVGTYTKSINCNKKEQTNYILDLGNVKEIAEIYANGKLVGTKWCKPYSIDVTNHLVSGKNNIKIKVVNTWTNRLLGDRVSPKDEKITRTVNESPAWYKKKPDLVKSGLMGPVTLNEIPLITN